MDGEKGVEDLGKAVARVFGFDEGDQSPDGALAVVFGRGQFAAQTVAKAAAEVELFGSGLGGVVEGVVAIGIKEAVAEDAGGEAEGLAKEGLESAGGPGIAAGLDDAGLGEGGVEVAGPAGEAGADGEKLAGEQSDGFGAEIEGGSGETGEGSGDAFGGAGAVAAAANTLRFTLDVAEGLVVGIFAVALFGGGEEAGFGQAIDSAEVPERGGASNFGLNPGPRKMPMHVPVYVRGKGGVPFGCPVFGASETSAIV